MESDLHLHCCASNNGMLTSALSIVVPSNNGMLTSALSIVVVKQWYADVSTFHCVSLHTETHFVPDPISEAFNNGMRIGRQMWINVWNTIVK